MRFMRLNEMVCAAAAAFALAAGGAGAADCNGNAVEDDSEFLSGATVAYQVDNNVHNVNWGIGGAADSVWINTFEVQPGGEYVYELSAYLNTYWTRGERYSLLVFDDPNNDGVPDDLVLLDQVETYMETAGWNTATLSPPVRVGEAGDKFFVGLFNSTNHQRYPAAGDSQTTVEGTWALAWSHGDVRFHIPGAVYALNPTKISEAFLIRANGRAAATDCNGNGKLDVCDPACGNPVVKALDSMHVNPLGPGQVQFQVAFSEPVVGVDATDFLITASPSMTGYAVTGVESLDGGSRYIVSASTGSGWGDMTLFMLDNDTIQDLDGNGIAGLTTGPICQVDARVASVATATQLDPTVVASGPVTYRLTYDMPVSGASTGAYVPTTFGPTSPGVLSVTPLEANPFAGAASFDKASTEYGQVPAGVWFYGPFTVEAWIYPRSYGTWSRIMDFGNGPGGENVLLAYSAGTSGYVSGDIWNSGTVQRVTSPARIPLNQWTHVAFTWDGVHGRIYMNGVETARAPIHGPSTTLRSNCYVGNTNWAGEGSSDIAIDEFRIWYTCLTRDELGSYMNGPIPGGTVGLLGCWRFDEGTGTTVADQAAGGNAMTLVNTPTWIDSDAPGVDEYDVELTASGDGLLRLDSASGTGPRNAAGRAVVFTGAEPYVLDTADPEVVAVTRLDDSPTNAEEVRWAVEFSEAISPSTTDDIELALGGTLQGSAPISAEAIGSAAVAFDGIDDHLAVPGVGQTLPTHEITVEFWQYVDESKQQATFAMSRDNGSNRLLAHVPWSDGKVYWDFGNIYAGGRISYTPPVSLVDSWHHFAFVASDAEGVMRIYRNGALEAETFTFEAFENYDSDLFVGRVAGRFFRGRVRDFRIWDRARTGAEIAADMDRRLEGTESGLYLYLPLDEYENLGVESDGVDDFRDLAQGMHADTIGAPTLLAVNRPHVFTVQAGTGTGTLELTFLDRDSVEDVAGKFLAGIGQGGGDTAGSDPYLIDTDAPGTWFTDAPQTKVGGAIAGWWAATDNGGAGVGGTVLHARERAGTWADAGINDVDVDSVVAEGDFAYSPPGDGIYHLSLTAFDVLGNEQEFPDGTENTASEQLVLYNDIPNSTFTHTVPGAQILGTYVFPMEDPDLKVTIQLSGVTSGGTLTVSRVESRSYAVGKVQDEGWLLDEGIVVEKSPSLQFASATLILPYEEANLTINENEINAVTALGDDYRQDYHGLVPNTADNTVTVTGVTHFSTWFLGNSSALPVELDAFSVE